MTTNIKLAILAALVAAIGGMGYTLHRNGYNSGYAAAQAKYQAAAQSQSEELLGGLERIYDKYDARMRELEQKNENYAKVLQTLGSADCHSDDSLHAINQRIAARRKGTHAAR